jgi:FMN phosphatase YigB (HAD superfamily)
LGSLNLDSSRIKNIVFDLDDTLVGSTAAYSRAMEKLGISENSEEFQRARKATKAQLPELAPAARNRFLYFKNYLEAHCDSQENRDDILQTAKFLSPVRADVLMNLAGKYDQLVAEDLWVQWRDLGRSSLVQSLLFKNFKIFVLTNESLRLQTLKLSGFSPEINWLSGFLVSEEVGFEKPNENIFQNFFKRFNLKASECVMIGDSYTKDIKPALELGMQAVLTEEFLKSDCSFSNRIRNLEELL